MQPEDRKIIAESPKGTIVICLDGTMRYNAISLKDFQLAVNDELDYICTPLTYAIDNFFCLKGYKVIVVSEGVQRCINDMLLGDIGPNERELRLAHNVEKMILSGVYNIETNWK